MHKPIKMFSVDGELKDDSVIQSTKQNVENIIDNMMMDAGYVRILDLDPIWQIDYNNLLNRWKFKMTMYGMYVGKRKARKFDGIAQWKLVPRNMPRATS